jgi:hypothetical protein
MPVILKHKNKATELGVTNRSQGVMVHFETNISTSGKTHLKCVFVYIDDCTVHLDGLPAKVVPMFLSKWTFKARLNILGDRYRDVKVVRCQPNLEPAFSFMAHASQGQTLLAVLSDLTLGSRASAYVVASRPTSRYGISLIKCVTLSDLNKPGNIDLICETERLNVLKADTYYRHGYLEQANSQVKLNDVSSIARGERLFEIVNNKWKL